MLTTRFATERWSSFKRALREVPAHPSALWSRRKSRRAIFVVEAPRLTMYKGELEGLAGKHPHLNIHYFVAPERITEQTLRKVGPGLSRPMSYVTGPEPMVEAVGRMVAGMGIPDAHVKQDFFPGYAWP